MAGCGTAVPPQRYTQKQCFEAVRAAPQFELLSARSRAILRKVFLGDNGIESRHLSLTRLEEAFDLTPDALQARFAANAPLLAAQAAERALRDANLAIDQVDALIISTCTGYLCPGLTSWVQERLGCRRDVLGLDLVGQGCGAAIPNLRTAEALLHSGKARVVLSVCVEVCSAAFYLDDDPGVLISACLFGDGAAAAVMQREPPSNHRSIEWLGATTHLAPESRELLRFEHRNGMLRNILDRRVPQIVRGPARTVLNGTLQSLGISREEISGWILHAGGRDILLSLQEEFGLGSEDVSDSASILRQFGNVSSPCVLFVLQSALKRRPEAGLWYMSSFGAGFSCHGAMWRIGQAA